MEIKVTIGMEKEMYERVDKIINALSGFKAVQREAVKVKAPSKPVEASADSQPADKPAQVKASEEPAEIEENSGYKTEDIIEALQMLAKYKGKPAAKELLQKFGASKVGELPEKRYGEFIKELEMVYNA